MRLLVLIALCFAVASASYANRNRFNRLLRNLQQQQQQQGQGYGSQDLYYQQEDDQDDDQCQDDEEDQYPGQQCPRNQRYGSLNLQDDDQECENGNCDQDDEDQQDQDQDYGYGQNQNQHQRRQQQQQLRRLRQQQQSGPQQQRKRQQQQRHQCQPKYQLLQELEQPNCRLASKLYKQAKQQNDDKNTVVSPAAVQLALAAIQRGARGNTKRQIQRLIGSGLSQQQQQQAHAALQQVLQGQDQQQQQNGQNQQQARVKTTTTIVINQKCQGQQKFIQAVKACGNAHVKKCNFQRQSQQCRQQINQYVAQKTNQKLRQAVPQDAVTTNTKMIVVNTAQLKARWGQQFRQQQQTKQGHFYPLGCQQPKPVQVLQSQGQFGHYEDQQLQVVGIPTQRQELTLYVIVPKDKDGLNQIEKEQIQNGQQLKQLLDQADQQQQQIDIELPKFQIKHKIDAKQTLQKQGVQDLCDADQADLSGICGQQGQQQQRRRQQQLDDSEDDDQEQGQWEQDGQQGQQQLHLNKLIHQATIKVDEQGISAARPGQHQQRQQQQDQQDQDQDQDEQQDDEDDEDQQEQYEQQQLNRQELYQNIFGQRQGQRQQRRQQRGQQRGQQQRGGRKVKVNRAFAFAIKHNPSNQIVMVGRVVDATQKPQRQQQQGRQQWQSLNGVDQQ